MEKKGLCVELSGSEGNVKRLLCPLGWRREGMSYGFKKQG